MTDPVLTDSASERSDDPTGPRSDDPAAQGAGSLRRAGLVALHVLRAVLHAAMAVLLLGWRALCAFGRFLRRWRAPLVILPLLVGLVYAAVLGGQMLWGDRTEEPVAAPDVTCWDDTEAPRAQCPAPTGVSGLQWVFPSFKPRGGRCEKVSFRGPTQTRPVQYDCVQPVAKSKATISYSQRSTTKRGLTYFEKRYAGTKPVKAAGGDRLVYRAAPRPDGTFETTVVYADHPFAVTIAADSKKVANAALERKVQFRPAGFMRVKPPTRK